MIRFPDRHFWQHGYDKAEYAVADKGWRLAFDQEEAAGELALTLPARSLGDAAVQVLLAFIQVDFLQTYQLTLEEIDARVSKLRRVLASVLPVVTRCAGLTIEQIGGEGIADLLSHEHPPVEV